MQSKHPAARPPGGRGKAALLQADSSDDWSFQVLNGPRARRDGRALGDRVVGDYSPIEMVSIANEPELTPVSLAGSMRSCLSVPPFQPERLETSISCHA